MSRDQGLELLRAELEGALLRLSLAEQRIAKLERRPLQRRIFDRLARWPDPQSPEDPMPPTTADAEPLPSPIFAAIFALHTLLGILGQACVLAATSGIVHEGPWRMFVGGLGGALNTGAIALGVRWQSPRQRAIMEEHSPTPERLRAENGLSALLPMLLLPLLFLSACTSAQTAAWRTFGIGVAQCAGSGVIDAAGDALTDLLTRIGGDSPTQIDPGAIGSALAAKYGAQAALCAVGKAAAVLFGNGTKSAATPAARTVAWLIDHQGEWAK